MIISMIEGVTRILGKSQGYLGLPIRDQTLGGAKVMVSAWEPTPEELQRLNSGAKVEVIILGTGHPPIRVEVGKGLENNP